jgi:hypothetical protein
MKRLVPCEPTVARHDVIQVMNIPEKKHPSARFIFLLGFLTGIFCSFINSIFHHWPAFKAAIAKMWN